jgi:hypothetical protein
MHPLFSKMAQCHSAHLTRGDSVGPLRLHGMKRKGHHHVYVVQLDDRVWRHARFRAANPAHELGKPLVYVGMTGLDPDVRFDKHKAGLQANRYVKDYGLHLLPQLYEHLNPMPYDVARSMEVELGIALRARGFAVWQA